MGKRDNYVSEFLAGNFDDKILMTSIQKRARIVGSLRFWFLISYQFYGTTNIKNVKSFLTQLAKPSPD